MVNQAIIRLGEFLLASNDLSDFVIGFVLSHLVRDVRHVNQPTGEMSLESIRQEPAGFAAANNADKVLFAIWLLAGESPD